MHLHPLCRTSSAPIFELSEASEAPVRNEKMFLFLDAFMSYCRYYKLLLAPSPRIEYLASPWHGAKHHCDVVMSCAEVHAHSAKTRRSLCT